MQIDSIMGGSGSSGLYEDKQSFGAAVVKSTLDTMNGSQDDLSSVDLSDKKSFGAAVVVKTMSYMNSKKGGGLGGSSNSLYDFNKSVLGAAYGDKGGIFSSVG